MRYDDHHDNPLTWARDEINKTPRESGYPFQKHEFMNPLGYSWIRLPQYDVPDDYQTPTQEANAIALYHRLLTYDPSQMWWAGSPLRGKFELKVFSFPGYEHETLDKVDWLHFDVNKLGFLTDPNLSQIAEWFHEEFEPVQQGRWLELDEELTMKLEEWNDLWHIENELDYRVKQQDLIASRSRLEASLPYIWDSFQKYTGIKELQYYKTYPAWVYEVYSVVLDRDQGAGGDGGYYGNINPRDMEQAAVDMGLIEGDVQEALVYALIKSKGVDPYHDWQQLSLCTKNEAGEWEYDDAMETK